MIKTLVFAAMLAANTFVPTLHEGDAVPAVPLIDQSGAAFSLASLRGDAVVLTFFYTRCPDARMCPLESLKFARIQHALRPGEPVKLVELTLDPRFDAPSVLEAYGRAYGADFSRWTLATGAPASLDDLATRLGVASEWTTPSTLVHTEATIVLDKQGTIAEIVDGNAWTVDQMLGLARDAAGEGGSPLARVGSWLTAAAQACGGGTLPLSAWELLAAVALLTGAFVWLLLRSMLRPSGRT